MLLVASYFFYGWWDWRFLFLIFISTLTDFVCGIKIHESDGIRKKKFVIISVVINLGILGFFKYWNFFSDSLGSLLSQLGLHPGFPTLHIILPVGISFYTFQTMTYSIDIYRGKLSPTYSFMDFALFVSFFPQLVAGPIERAGNLLPQIEGKRNFDQGRFLRGIELFFWGLFKKVFVADNLGIMVDRIYGNPESTGMEYVIATWAFAFQIYGDFSGYTDMARGTAKCLGIELMHNFKQPYFAVNPSDLWRRWHISLSSWLRDYLYIPLGGNRKGKIRTYINLMITMLLGGLWHGAAWNFVIWGGYHGFLLWVHRLATGNTKMGVPTNTSLGLYMLKAFIMFQFTCLGWIFFRSQNLDQIGMILKEAFSLSSLDGGCGDMFAKLMFFCFLPLFIMVIKTLKEVRPDYFSKPPLFIFSSWSTQPLYVKSISYGVLTYLLCLYGAKTQSFIYFQF